MDINVELRKLHNKYDRPAAVEAPGDLELVERLTAERPDRGASSS
jgi:hypothetical protein